MRRKNLLITGIVLSVILLLTGIGVIAYGIFETKSDVMIYSLQVTNLTPTSATIVWKTDTASVGGIVIKDEDVPLSTYKREVFFRGAECNDSRDMEQKEDGTYELVENEEYTVHHVTVRDLSPDTEYSFAIVSDKYIVDDQLFSTFSTPQMVETIKEPAPVYGSIEGDNVDIGGSVLVAQALESGNADVNRNRSSKISVPLTEGTYVLDVANLYLADNSEEFPSVLENLDRYDIHLTVITPQGEVEHVVRDGNLQPVNTLRISTDTSQVLEERVSFVLPAYAKCNSECVGDCQGCNTETPNQPECVTYGCGYMSWCCGYGSDDCANHCTNGKKDCDETGVDCGGGGCATCNDGNTQQEGECAGQCVRYDGGGCVDKNPVSGDCKCAVNGKQDSSAGENGVDCGGPYCPECSNPGSHCFNGKKDGDETGTDCGGSCAAKCTTEKSSKSFGEPCSNNGEIFTCANRPDWDCVCWGGTVAYFQKKEGSEEVGYTEEPSDVPQEESTTGFDDGYTAPSNSGTEGAVQPGSGKNCSYGDCIYACVEYDANGNPKTYVTYKQNPGCPGGVGDTFVQWGGTTEVVQFLSEGRYATKDGVDQACFYNHADMGTEFKEHEWVCVGGSKGGNAGVGGGQGYNPPNLGLISRAYAASEIVEPGIYTVTGVNVDVKTETIEVLEAGRIRFFYDTNENGVLDRGERYLMDDEAEPLEIELQKEADVVMYNLSEGWNSAAFPLVMSDSDSSGVQTASDLIDLYKDNGIMVNHVAAYRNHEFLIYSKRVDDEGNVKEYGTNYGILPGEGYFIKSANSGSVGLVGQFPSGSMPVTLLDGWNLIGFYKEGTDSFEAFSLLESMNTAEIPADTLSKWDAGRYTSAILDEKEYGDDFNVYPKGGYWVRVQYDDAGDSKVFTP